MQKFKLSEPQLRGTMSVEEAIFLRYSCRNFSSERLNEKQVSQLLFVTQGTTKRNLRAVPSAGATYPLEIYCVIGDVDQIEVGIHHYLPKEHSLTLIKQGDVRAQLCEAALHQIFIYKAPLTILIAADYSRTTCRYGERGIKYVHMEAGHVGQNLHLQCVALNLGCVMVGAFIDAEVAKIFNLSKNLQPLYLVPVGVPAQ